MEDERQSGGARRDAIANRFASITLPCFAEEMDGGIL